jgi:hypothetical protein
LHAFLRFELCCASTTEVLQWTVPAFKNIYLASSCHDVDEMKENEMAGIGLDLFQCIGAGDEGGSQAPVQTGFFKKIIIEKKKEYIYIYQQLTIG